MNKIIFLYSFKRFFEWNHVILGGLIMLASALAIAAMWSSSIGLAAEFSRWALFGPVVPLATSSIIIMPKVANSQQRKDGEYLSLLFTRPVSRTSYVLTKWLSASVFVFTIVMLEALMASAIAWLAATVIPGSIAFRPMIDAYAIIDAILNSMSFSALFVLLAACPARIRLWLWLGLITFLSVTMGTLGVKLLLSGVSLFEASQMMAAAMRFACSLFTVSADSYHIINSAESPLTSILIYTSNVVLYLTLASVILCQREFFYAND